MVGRKPLITKKVIDSLYGYISQGMPNKHAIALSNISEKSFYNHRDIAENIEADIESGSKLKNNLTAYDKNHLQFIQSLREADAHYLLGLLKNHNRLAKDSVAGTEWAMTRKDRASFGNVETVINQKMPDLIEFDDEN